MSIFVEDLDKWHKMLDEMGFKISHSRKKSGDLDMRSFLTWDPKASVFDFITFDTTPYGE